MRAPKVSLAMLLYVVTAAAIYVRVEMATANTRLNNPVGGAVLWLLIGGGVGLWLWRRGGW